MKKDYFLGVSEEGFHKIAYTEWGQSQLNTAPVLCVHGFSRTGRDFDSLANHLSLAGKHVFCPDVVGRGASSWMKNSLHYTYEQYAADMNAMIARINAQQIDWIGTSMGGLIGMFLASLPNSPIRRLVINDIGPQIPLAAITRISERSALEPEFTSLEEAIAYFKIACAAFGTLNDEQWKTFTEHSIREVSPGKFTTNYDPGIKRTAIKSKFTWNTLLNPQKILEGTFFDVDLWHVWRKITCPVLVVHGVRSDFLLPSIIEKMQSIHQQVEVLTVEDAGHAPALQDVKQLEAIQQWLNKT